MEQQQEQEEEELSLYPHVLALTCEDESCNLRCLPPIPLQTEEDTTSMAARRRNILAQPEQFATDRLSLVAQRSTATSSSSQHGEQEPQESDVLGGRSRKNRSPFDEDSELPLKQQEEQQKQPSDDETEKKKSLEASGGGCDERGYELPYSRVSSNSRTRKRSMSVQLPCLSQPYLAAVDRGNWNARFQKVIEYIYRIGLNTHTSEKLKAFEELRDLASDFSDAAKRYASIIITEVRLPDEEKTIKPVPTIAGLAGGKKYVAHQILFKFAVDSSGLFGEFATLH